MTAQRISGVLTTIQGRILNWDPATMKGVRVQASAGRYETATSTGYVPEGIVEADGSFVLPDVPAGLHMVFLALSDDRTYAGTGAIDIPADPAESVSPEFSLHPTAPATVSIVDESGHALPDIRINLRPIVEDQIFTNAERILRTDENSQLHVDGAVPGLEYTLIEWSENDHPAVGELDANGERIKPLSTTMVLLPE